MKRALLICDMQNDYVLPANAEGHNSTACVAGAWDTVPRLIEVLKFFRKNDWPVIHVTRRHHADGSDVETVRRQEFLACGGYAVADTYGEQIVAGLEPIGGEYHITKTRFSAFMGTSLDLILRRLRINQLVISGNQYPYCIRMSAFDGIALDYNIVVITDATSAANDQVATSNIHDMKSIGIQCQTFDTYKSTIENT